MKQLAVSVCITYNDSNSNGRVPPARAWRRFLFWCVLLCYMVVGLFLDKWYYPDKLELFISARQQHGNIEFSIVRR